MECKNQLIKPKIPNQPKSDRRVRIIRRVKVFTAIRQCYPRRQIWMYTTFLKTTILRIRHSQRNHYTFTVSTHRLRMKIASNGVLLNSAFFKDQNQWTRTTCENKYGKALRIWQTLRKIGYSNSNVAKEVHRILTQFKAYLVCTNVSRRFNPRLGSLRHTQMRVSV